TSADADSIVFDFEMISSAGEAAASIQGMRLKEAPRDFLANQSALETSNFFYQTEWRPLSLPTDQPAAPTSASMLVCADNDFAAAIKASLPESNVESASLQTAAQTELDLSRFGCIILHVAANEQSPANAAKENTVLLVQFIQRLLQQNASAPIFVLTQNAQSVLPDDPLAGFASAPLWGVMKCLMQERPALPCAMIDADDWSLAANQLALMQVASSSIKENQIALRNGAAYAARLARCQPRDEGEVAVRPDASYLITGGLRGVGFAAAQWLVERGAKYLLLAGCSGKLDAASEAFVNEWKQRGVQVHCARCDVADAAQVNALAKQLPQGFPPLGGVIHSAGVLDDASIVNLSEERIRSVFAPKVDGAMNLHHATKEMQLDFFVLFSSLSAVWGAQGQANYVAANSFLDGFAHWRRAQGLPALSVNWGPWRETGMAANKSLLAQFESQGVRALSNQDGLASLSRLMSSGAAQCAVADIHWARLLQQIGADGTPPLLSELAQQEQPKVLPSTPSNLLETLLSLPEEKRKQPFGDYVAQQVVSVLRIPESQFDAQAPLSRLGVDSLMAVELRNRFQRELKIDAPIPIFLDGSDTQTLIERLLQRFEQSSKTQPAQVKAKPSPSELADNLNSSNAEKLLEKIDDLSDEEIDALFGSAVKEMNGDAEN
ncbi:SDR family NAD(P)-dependent oxidoreductase, partial [bacterium]|nr:SDR family NAD(P)-dependent oxidoreductase [bacterium]